MKYRKNSIYYFLRHQSILRRKRRSNKKKRQKNILRNVKQSQIHYSKKPPFKPYYEEIKNIEIHAGKTFSLFSYPLIVIKLVNEIDSFKKNDSLTRRIMIDLSEITEIDIGAITFLLGKVNEMSNFKNVSFWGNRPLNQACNNIFTSSGFLDYMSDLSGKKFERRGENYIISIGSNKTLNELVGNSIKNSMNYMTGNYDHFPPIFSIVQEICSNSVEHANSEHKNWLFGINYESNENDKWVIFTMTDIGKGILQTIKRNFETVIKEKMSNKRDDEILYRAFQKQYQSTTEDVNRNRGLPLILDRFEKGYIKELKVITNNVFLDFESLENSKIISKNLPGTFYYWKLDLNCIEKWSQININ